jgi:hypothetical protein
LIFGYSKSYIFEYAKSIYFPGVYAPSEEIPGGGIFIRKVCNISIAFFFSILLLVPGQIHGDYGSRIDFPAGDSPHALGAADLDDDGDMDIVTADYYDDNISVLMNDGNGFFTKQGQYRTGDAPRSLSLGDVNGDGYIDVVTANYHGDTVSVLKNNGDGTFASGGEFSAGSGPFSVFLSDVREDGGSDLDIICADEQDSKVTVLENDGNGTFGNEVSYSVGNRPKGVSMADLDGDGYNDIACANWADDTISILMNKGDGTFEKRVDYDTGSAPRALYLGFLNSDNHPDIVCANQYDNSVSVLKNNDDGTFAGKIDYLVGTNPLSVFLGDMNGDNKIDILTTNLHNDSVSVLFNDGNGVFPERDEYDTDWGPYAVLLANVNLDGKVDIITANNYADTVSIRYSNLPPEISIVKPDGVDDTANSTYTITWQDYDADEDALISLYWDDDAEDHNGVEIVEGLSEDDDGIGGAFTWDISGIPDGEYWIYARISDGISEPVFDYSAGPLSIDHSIIANTPPTLQITDPDGESDVADGQFTITWMDSDPDDDSVISLYFDTDWQGLDGTLIVSGLSEDADGGFGYYVWDTSSLVEGIYYVYGICNDGNNEPISTYSLNPVSVNHTSHENDPPLLRLTEPDGQDDFANTMYMIIWIDSDSDSDAAISLYYDSDISGFDGTLIASGLSEDEFGGSGAYIWNTSSIPEGEYFIYGTINDGEEDARDYSPGALTISHSGIHNTSPSIVEISPLEAIEEAHDTFVIRWMDLDPDDDAKISLYYDSDQTGLNGILIVEGISEDKENNSYTWNTQDVPEGDYYIYGIIDDGVNAPVFDYSHGILRIDHDDSENGEDSSSGKDNESYGSWLLLLIIVILILALIILRRHKRDKDLDEPEEFSENKEPKEDGF